MTPQKSLTELILQSQRASLEQAWGETQAAEELQPLPPGMYRCMAVAGSLFTAKNKGTLGFKLTLEVAEGEHAGRRLWHDLWLTPAAMAMTKRDLAKLGVTELGQLERPLPEGIVVAATVALRRDEDGTERNRVTKFDVVAVEPPTPDPFTPVDETEDPDPESP